MPEVNEAAYRISGRFGEAYYLDPTGVRAPRKLFEATQCSFTKSIGQTDVMLAGNQTGTKDGAEEPGTVTLTLTQVDQFFENFIYAAFNQNLAARRAARDAGERIARTFMLQVWQDDPEALGALGWQLEGVRLSTINGGFDFSDEVTSREHSGRFERFKQIQSFERVGNEIDQDTGLPKINYTIRG